MHQTAPVTPVPFFDVVTAYQRSAAMKAAVELNIFTTIGKGSSIAAEIAEATGTSERGVRILCDSLVVMGFLNKTENAYSLNDLSAAFLDRSSRTYVGDAVDFLMSDAQMRGFENLADAVRRGGADPSGNASIAPDSEMWVKFARGMMPMMYPTAEMTASQIGMAADANLKMLDIAAGHGAYGILAAMQYPNSEVYAVDWPNVLAVAKENAARFDVADRYHTIEGDAFTTDWGGDYDVILVPNFLHHFDHKQCTEFLRKCRGALKDPGKVVIVEFIPNEDRVSPPMEAMFSLIMLAATPSGDAYTFTEIREMCESAGFTRNEHISLEPLPSHLVISMK